MDWQTLLPILATVTGVLGIFKGVEVYFVRRRANPSMVPGDQQSLTTSGSVPSLSYVLSGECKSIHADLREAMDRQTSSIQEVRESVIRLEGRMETSISDVGKEIVEAMGGSISKHEDRFHRGSGTTGDFRKVR